MLTALIKVDGVKVLARDSEKILAPFICPQCKSEVVLHKGLIRIHHFKHKPPITCSRGQGESEQHLRAKLAIRDALTSQPNVSNVEIEKDFRVSVADVYAEVDGIPVVVEIQRSNLSIADISKRTINYHQLGIAVVWVGLPCEELSGDAYSPSAWERWCHAVYFGRVYYWHEGQTFRAIHFDAYEVLVEGHTWYESGGYEHSTATYWKTSKRYKTPNPGASVKLSHGFKKRFRQAWSGGTVEIPACTLFVDNQEKWWSQ